MSLEHRFSYLEDLDKCSSFWNHCLMDNLSYNKVFSPPRYRQVCASTVFYLGIPDFNPTTRQVEILSKCLQWWKEIFTYGCALTDEAYKRLLDSTVGYLEEISRTYDLANRDIAYDLQRGQPDNERKKLENHKNELL